MRRGFRAIGGTMLLPRSQQNRAQEPKLPCLCRLRPSPATVGDEGDRDRGTGKPISGEHARARYAAAKQAISSTVGRQTTLWRHDSAAKRPWSRKPRPRSKSTRVSQPSLAAVAPATVLRVHRSRRPLFRLLPCASVHVGLGKSREGARPLCSPSPFSPPPLLHLAADRASPPFKLTSFGTRSTAGSRRP